MATGVVGEVLKALHKKEEWQDVELKKLCAEVACLVRTLSVLLASEGSELSPEASYHESHRDQLDDLKVTTTTSATGSIDVARKVGDSVVAGELEMTAEMGSAVGSGEMNEGASELQSEELKALLVIKAGGGKLLDSIRRTCDLYACRLARHVAHLKANASDVVAAVTEIADAIPDLRAVDDDGDDDDEDNGVGSPRPEHRESEENREQGDEVVMNKDELCGEVAVRLARRRKESSNGGGRVSEEVDVQGVMDVEAAAEEDLKILEKRNEFIEQYASEGQKQLTLARERRRRREECEKLASEIAKKRSRSNLHSLIMADQEKMEKAAGEVAELNAKLTLRRKQCEVAKTHVQAVIDAMKQ